ncbi:MAG TPA: hypothetical protein VMB73_19840 [Acetobacteraceae bacterium]|nr:hypothetical protein [Acetobacteraceae bacterium]
MSGQTSAIQNLLGVKAEAADTRLALAYSVEAGLRRSGLRAIG